MLWQMQDRIRLKHLNLIATSEYTRKS